MSSTDALSMNKTEMFAKIRAGLPVERYTQNLLESKDDLLFVWESQDSCLLVVNWRTANTDGFDKVKYQTLIPAVPQSFNVDRILGSNESSLIALAGARGVTVLELPRRCGQNGLFMEGKSEITCRATNLDALFFNNNPHLELRQLRWHPTSPTDSHLLVLLSDNTIRVYDNTTLRHVWQVGPKPFRNDNNPNSSLIYALGESVVDFDFAPPTKLPESNLNQSKRDHLTSNSIINSTLNLSRTLNNNTTITTEKPLTKTKKIEWPIILLRENGNIYVLMASLDTDKPRLQGPITITPQTPDNYGLDSCAILVIPSLPPTLIIAETNGKLHHALFMEAEDTEDSFNDVDSSLVIHASEWTVHVLETVELEMGLPKQDTVIQAHSSPVHLKRDFINELRYFAYHNTGLHGITVNFINELQRYLNNDVASDTISLSTPSQAEYIVCTKADSGDSINAVLGFVLLQMPSGIVMLLGSGQVVSLKLVIDTKLLLTTMASSNAIAQSTKTISDILETQALVGPSFLDHVKSILQKRAVTQPLLSLDKAISPQDCYELLTQAMEVLRNEYLKRHELVRVEFAKRISAIRLRKEQQLREIEQLEREREVIRERAHKLAERFEEISDEQEMLDKKCQDLIRQSSTCLPSNAIIEQDFALEVDRINKVTKAMSSALNKARENINKQAYHISKYKESDAQKKFELPPKQEQNIQEILLQITSEVDGQIQDIKRINKIVGL